MYGDPGISVTGRCVPTGNRHARLIPLEHRYITIKGGNEHGGSKMKKKAVEATDYEKVIIYPSEIEESRVRKLLEVMAELDIPVFYEQY